MSSGPSSGTSSGASTRRPSRGIGSSRSSANVETDIVDICDCFASINTAPASTPPDTEEPVFEEQEEEEGPQGAIASVKKPDSKEITDAKNFVKDKKAFWGAKNKELDKYVKKVQAAKEKSAGVDVGVSPEAICETDQQVISNTAPVENHIATMHGFEDNLVNAIKEMYVNASKQLNKSKVDEEILKSVTTAVSDTSKTEPSKENTDPVKETSVEIKNTRRTSWCRRC